MKKFLLILEFENEKIIGLQSEEIIDLDEDLEELNLVGKFSI